MFLHVFYTWLIANLLHPIAFFFGIQMMDDFRVTDNFSIQFLFYGFAYSLLFSLPCLVLAWVSLCLVLGVNVTAEAKFLIWLLAAPLLALLEVFIIILISDFEAMDLLSYAVPGMVTTALAILCRATQFQKLVKLKMDTHENHFV